MFSKTAISLLVTAALVAAHGEITDVVADGVSYKGAKNYDAPENQKVPVRGLPLDTGFVNFANVASSMDIACSSSGYKGTPVTAPVTAGSQIKIRWGGNQGPDQIWPHPEGPQIDYLAPCNGDCANLNSADAKFFKIQELGLDTSKQAVRGNNDHDPWGKGRWAQNQIQVDNGWAFVTIPADIAPGNYLLRHELISLHGAHTAAEGAQYYPQCIQLAIKGTGTSKPAGIAGTSLYKRDDGLVDIYSPFPGGIEKYNIPGPALYKAGSVVAPATTTAATTSVAAPTTTKPASTSAAAAAAVTSAVISSSVNYNAPGAATTSVNTYAAPSATPVKSCKAKRSSKNRVRSTVQDETRALYDRALTGAQARRHAKRSSDSF